VRTWNRSDVLLSALTFIASALGAAGGIGGGGIMVPMLVAVGGFSIHHAIPLTQVKRPRCAQLDPASLLGPACQVSPRDLKDVRCSGRPRCSAPRS
jgi:hypothetical protein